MRDVVAWRWRLVAVAFGLSTSSCAGFVLRQDVESARTAWQINPSGQQAVSYAEALHEAFWAGLRRPDGRLQRPGGRSAVGPRHLREPRWTSASDAHRGPRSLASGSRAQSRRMGGASTFDGRRADAGGRARHRFGLGGAGPQRRGARRVRPHAAGDARGRQPFSVARSLREEHARRDRCGGAGLGAAGGARVLSRRARATRRGSGLVAALKPATSRRCRWPPSKPNRQLSWPVRRRQRHAQQAIQAPRRRRKLDRAWQVDGVPVMLAPGGPFHACPASAFRWPCGWISV